ncbi:MAG TPA: universal stress protein [Gemmatimonadales bacterium]|nr:universal stress protein [Gemmatimonadales bacterium]
MEPTKFPTVVPVTLDREEFYRRSVTAFRRLAVRLANVAESDLMTPRGTAVEMIEAEAAGWPADVVVVGSHGKGWVDRLIVGSVTERLLNRLPASLLVIPAPRGATTPARPRARKRTGRTKRKARHERL